MDVMKIKSDFLRKLLGKYIRKQLKNKLDMDCDVFLKDIDIVREHGKMKAHIDVELIADDDDVTRLLSNL